MDEIEKRQPFGTFGGSYKYAKRICAIIPEHKIYVEPFAGAAAVLHRKEPSAKEVIADMDDDVVFLHRSVQSMTPEKVEKLRKFNWKVSKESFDTVRGMTPRNDIERFYKLVFIRTHARDCRPDGTHPALNHLGSVTDPEKFLSGAERLKDVSILKQDYRKTIKQFDGSDTFFFVDPPYPDEWFDKDAVIDMNEFIETMAGVKGKFVAVINNSAENREAFKKIGTIFKIRMSEALGTGGTKQAFRLFCSNFKTHKAADVRCLAKRMLVSVIAARMGLESCQG